MAHPIHFPRIQVLTDLISPGGHVVAKFGDVIELNPERFQLEATNFSETVYEEFLQQTAKLHCRWREGIFEFRHTFELSWNQIKDTRNLTSSMAPALAETVCGKPIPKNREPSAIKPLTWSQNFPPASDCPYDHCNETTGTYRIEWKGWKDHGNYDFTIYRENDYIGTRRTLDDAKRLAQELHETWLSQWLKTE